MHGPESIRPPPTTVRGRLAMRHSSPREREREPGRPRYRKPRRLRAPLCVPSTVGHSATDNRLDLRRRRPARHRGARSEDRVFLGDGPARLAVLRRRSVRSPRRPARAGEAAGGHFERWLALWRATVDELFAGERAELAKAHAVRVAQAFHRRLEPVPVAVDPAPRLPADSQLRGTTPHILRKGAARS